jgi:hypothetical protein
VAGTSAVWGQGQIGVQKGMLTNQRTAIHEKFLTWPLHRRSNRCAFALAQPEHVQTMTKGERLELIGAILSSIFL